jgi:hypothetical protein
MSIARIIYNGFSYNFGSQDGAVTIMDGFTLWRFIAPVDRFEMADYAEMTLREALEEIIKETEAVPVPAWDEFFSFLAGREDYANAVFIGVDVMRIGGVKVRLPLIQNCNDFASFMRWLSDNVGEAGNLPAGEFIAGQDMMIPIDMYSAVHVSITLKTPTQRPPYEKDTTLWGKQNGLFNDPVFFAGQFVYAFEPTTDKHGTTVPQGWSAVSGIGAEDEDPMAYTPYDMEANPVTVPIAGGSGLEFAWQEKMFMDIEYDESTEVLDGTINFLFRA